MGVLGFELLSGQRLFRGSTEEIVVRKLDPAQHPLHAAGDVWLPEAVRGVLGRALSYEGQDRWPDAASFRRALEHALAGAAEEPVPSRAAEADRTILLDSQRTLPLQRARQPLPGVRAGEARRRSRMLLAVAVAGGMLAAGLALTVPGSDHEVRSTAPPAAPSHAGARPEPPQVSTSAAPAPLPLRAQATAGDRRGRRAPDPGGSFVPDGMVAVEAGAYAIGCAASSARCWPDERPAHTVTLRRFALDRTEVTVARYAGCVADGACAAPGRGRGCTGGGANADLPITRVSWHAAADYCRRRGGAAPDGGRVGGRGARAGGRILGLG